MQSYHQYRFNLLLPAALLITGLFSACRKTELEPQDYHTDELVWNDEDPNGNIASSYLRGLYNFLPGGFNRINGDFLDVATDDAVASRVNIGGNPIYFYTNGAVSVVNNPDPYWTTAYRGIRAVNILLKNVGRVPLPATRLANWKAESRFIRAFLYWELLKRYGGVPLVGDTVFAYTDNLQLSRNSFAEVVNYINTECRAIKADLRDEASIPDGEWGTVPKGAAVALRSRLWLYAASPLYNGEGVEDDAAKRALTGFTTKETGRWDSVINACQEFEALGTYYSIDAVPFMKVFLDKKNKDVILAKQGTNNYDIEINNGPIGYSAPATGNGWTSPTQNLVDAFPMLNGKAITAAGSGYDAANPYNNRDPRLVLTVLYNNAKWLSKNIETFEGGKDKPNKPNATQTQTGYYLRKFMGDFATGTTYSNQSHNFILLRYAEVILNYAEALNEAGRLEDALKQVYRIRKRAGIQAGADNRYGIATTVDQDGLRTIIRNERRVELAFEEHRFWDIRRWKILQAVYAAGVKGAVIIKNTDGTFTYNLQAPLTLNASFSFRKAFYHMPLPYDELLKDSKLVQNEGW